MVLPQGWFLVTAESAAKLEAELRRELPVGHELHGRQVRAFARREDGDDVLFLSASDDGPVFWVHLTWAKETDPGWPSTETYANLKDFLERWPREELEEGLGYGAG